MYLLAITSYEMSTITSRLEDGLSFIDNLRPVLALFGPYICVAKSEVTIEMNGLSQARLSSFALSDSNTVESKADEF